MKCDICKTTKGKRICMMKENKLICSECCGNTRNKYKKLNINFYKDEI